MTTILAGATRTGHRIFGLEQVELLLELAHMTGVPATEWLNCPNETTADRAARLERLADVMLGLDDALAARVAALHRRVLGEPGLAPLVRHDYDRGSWYCADSVPGLDSTVLTVSRHGHWFASSDEMNEMNDRACRGCGATGHWEYIIDSTAGDCPAAPSAADIRSALGVPSATPVEMPAPCRAAVRDNAGTEVAA